MVEKKEKVIKGLVKAVISGDYIQISRSTKSEGHQEINAYLASVSAPKMGSNNRVEEAFGFDAREFLREKVIGRKCEFYLEYQYGGRDYGTLIVNEENLNLSIIKAGLAKVVEKKGNIPASSKYDELVAAQQEAKNKKLGVFSTDEKHIQKHLRNVTYFSDSSYSVNKLFEEGKNVDKPLEAIVEYVFSASYLTVYIHKFQTVAKVSLVHLFTPQKDTDKAIINDGKAFTEKLLLHRTVGVKFERVEEGGNLYVRLFHPAGDISYEILKNGFSKLTQPKNIDFDADYYKTLKEAQLIAQSKNLRLWKDFKNEEKKQQKASTTDFTGRVVEIHSGDSLTIERESDYTQVRVYLATVKSPILMKKPGEDPDPYAWESKEALRKATIGKKVKVVMEFSKTVKAGEGERNMDFATVFLEKNNKNVSTILLEKGLTKTNITKSGDNASKFFEDLLAAEKKAVDQKLGLHSNASAPIRIYNDLVANPKKSKDFEAMVMKRPNRKMNGVVEYCFSGMRFKVRLDGENTAIAFNLLGVRTMTNDKNQPQLLELANEAQSFAKDTIFQKDVIVEPDFADKRGTFFGSLTLKSKKDFGLMLIQEGLAQVSIIGNKAPHNIDQLEQAENQAKQDGLGIWDKDVKVMGETNAKQVKQDERIQVLMTDIQDASSFHLRIVNDNQYSKIEQELKKFDHVKADDLEKPIKKGTLCAARFKVDDNWYRGKIIRSIGKGQFEVQFIDFGNIDVVNGDDLKKLTQSLLQHEPQAKLSTLAYIKVQRINNDIGEEAAKLVQSIALDKVTDAIVVDQSEGKLKVVLFPKGEKDWNNSVNCNLVAEGLAMMQKFDEDNDEYPEEINDWFTFEEEAKENNLKIWQYGGADGDESD